MKAWNLFINWKNDLQQIDSIIYGWSFSWELLFYFLSNESILKIFRSCSLLYIRIKNEFLEIITKALKNILL